MRSVHFLARWYESTPSAAGAAGHGRGPEPRGDPLLLVSASEHRTGGGEEALSAPSEPEAPGPLPPKRLARISAPQFAPYKLYELRHFTYFGLDFVFFPAFFKAASLQDDRGYPLGENTHTHILGTRGPKSRSTHTFYTSRWGC